MVDSFDSGLTLRGIGVTLFSLWTSDKWYWYHYIGWVVIIIFALEILAQLVLLVGEVFNVDRIPPQGRPLDKLTLKDLGFISFNKLTTTLFTYHFLSWAWNNPNIIWDINQIHLYNNTILPLILLYIVYDFFYTLFHMALHNRYIYVYIHKHHHRQMVPSRGNVDAVNVHPFEFVSGEYNHLLSMFLVSYFGIQIHIITCLVFVVLGGFLASLNHTRFDIKFPLLNGIYQVKFHDIHHWSPYTNYGQYIMLWDYIFGSFRDYDTELKKKKNRKNKNNNNNNNNKKDK